MVAQTLGALCQTNRYLKHFAEGIQQAKEALEIHKQLNDKKEQAQCLNNLAYLLCDDKQLDAAEEAALQTNKLLSDTDDQHTVCESYRLLGHICSSKGQREKAIKHYEAALEIASLYNWHSQLFWNHHSLAQLFCDQGRFDDAHTHITHAKSYTTDNTYYCGRAMRLQASILYQQGRLEEAKSEAMSAFDVYQKLGASNSMEYCGKLLQLIEKAMNGEFLKIVSFCMLIHFLFLAQGVKGSRN
jgi:tetratricopeptide (TPR) repeat protein